MNSAAKKQRIEEIGDPLTGDWRPTHKYTASMLPLLANTPSFTTAESGSSESVIRPPLPVSVSPPKASLDSIVSGALDRRRNSRHVVCNECRSDVLQRYDRQSPSTSGGMIRRRSDLYWGSSVASRCSVGVGGEPASASSEKNCSCSERTGVAVLVRLGAGPSSDSEEERFFNLVFFMDELTSVGVLLLLLLLLVVVPIGWGL